MFLVIEFSPNVRMGTAERNILAVNAMILWFKVFKYTQFLGSMKIITHASKLKARGLLFKELTPTTFQLHARSRTRSPLLSSS